MVNHIIRTIKQKLDSLKGIEYRLEESFLKYRKKNFGHNF